MQQINSRRVRRALRLSASISAFILILFPSAALAAEGIEASSDTAISLLVISFVLSVCILVVSGFSLWQSHRYYLDTVRLSRDMTATTTELHQKVLELIYNLKDFLAHESEIAERRTRKPTATQAQATSTRVGKIIDSISHTENKIRSIEKTLGRLNEQLSLNFHSTDVAQRVSALNDTEFAVLLKLSQDPRFFEKNSFSSFGATPKVLDALLSRQLVIFDRNGKAQVPKEVAMALRSVPPRN